MAKSKFAALLVAGSLILSSLVGCTPSSPVTPSSNSATPQSSINQGESSQGGEQGSSVTPTPSSNVTPQPSSNVNPQPSSQVPGPNSSNNPQPSSQPVDSGWTNEQTSLMQDMLYGLVLPYLDGANVMQQMGTEKNVYMYASDVSATSFQQYVAKLIADGWDMQDIGALMSAPAQSVYMAQRAVETKDGTRYIVVMVTCLDSNYDYATSGMLSLVAQDPYIYTYNDAINLQVNLLANAGFANIDIIPELAGVKYYSFNQYDEEEGALEVDVYIDSTKEDAGLTAVLKAANWVVKDEKNAQGFYIAYPPQNGFVLEYRYFAEAGVLELLFKPGVGWNEATIESFYKKYNKTPIAFPKLEIDGASYKFAEAQMNETYAQYGYYYSVEATMTVSHSSINAATIKNYVGELRKLGFVCNTYDEGQSYTITKMIGEDDLYYGTVALVKNGTKTDFVLTIRADGQPGSGRTQSWPTQKIAAALADAVNDSLPAYTGVNAGFKTEIEGNGGYVAVYLDDELAKNAVASYEQILKNNGFTLVNTLSDGQNEFHSANDEIYARAFMDVMGADYILMIGFKYLAPATPTAWPSEDIVKAIKNNLYQGSQITDTIPAFEVGDASDCYVATNYTSEFEIRIEGIGATYADTVKAGLEKAGYTYDPFYQFDTNQTGGYVSPNKQLVIHVYTVGKDVMLAVKTYFDQRYAEWPSDIPLIIAGWGATDTVPAFEQAWYIEKLEKENKVMDITVMTADNNTAKALYEEILVKAGYKFNSELNGFKSPNNQLLVGVTIASYSLVITVQYIGEGGGTPITTGQWPANELAALFGEDFIIPKPNKTDISYEVAGTQNTDAMKMLMITATVTDGSAIATVEAFVNYLVSEYGYVYDASLNTCTSQRDGMPSYMFSTSNDNPNVFIIGVYTMNVAQSDTFPIEDIAKVTGVGAENIVDLSIEGASYQTMEDSENFGIAVAIVLDETMSADIDDYVAATKAKLADFYYDETHDAYIDINTGLAYFITKHQDAIEVDVYYEFVESASLDAEEVYDFFEVEETGNELPNPNMEVTYQALAFTDVEAGPLYVLAIKLANGMTAESVNPVILRLFNSSESFSQVSEGVYESADLRVTIIGNTMLISKKGASGEEGLSYNSVLADFKAVTGIQLPQMDGLTVDEFPYEEGDTTYCLDITGGESLSHDTFDTLAAFLDTKLADWEREVSENEDYYIIEYTSIYGDWIQLLWDINNECVYLNAVMNDSDVIEASSYEQAKAILADLYGINLPNYENAQIGDNSFAKDGKEVTFAFSNEDFTSATFDEIVAIFTAKFGDPVAELSYSEDGYLSETWIGEDMMVYTVYWNPDTLSIDINIMLYTE